MQICTSIDIDAPVERVWAILVDFENYPGWNPLTVKIKGDPEVGHEVTLYAMLGGRCMKRKHCISRVEPNQALCWTIVSNRPWLMRGERCQQLEDLGNGRCRYTNDERVEGLASIPVALLYKAKISRALDQLGEALKQQAENA
jgi:hypothetical protein